MNACPPREAIAAYLEGGASPESRRSLESHLSSCATCREIRDKLNSDGGLFDRIRQAGQETTVLTPDGSDSRASQPRWIGQYHLRRVIASGGMGTVYEAVQKSPRRIVALKIMKAGIASKAAMRRFKYESQILARLRHPNIAQVFEAGSHTPSPSMGEGRGEGVPYFAMEYIPGAKSITDYAGEKKLGVKERLKLFMQVIGAIQHGHQRGVIHRDLKPGNILVDSLGQAKIIDFGVARATDSDMAVTTLQTDVGQLLGTLQYMSPEQCAADPHDLDVRSDIYALGVVLYELLCGQLPYEVSRTAIHEAARVIREQAPRRPSTISRMIRGDIETITLKALEKDRTRRYQSADELGSDIQRYLAGEPIAARPPSVWYHLRKQASKHRRRIATTATIILALAAAVYYSEKSRTAGRIAARSSTLAEASAALLEAPSRPDYAIGKLEQIVGQNPDMVEERIRLAYLLKRQNRYDEAIEQARAVLKSNPEAGEAHLLLSMLYRGAYPDVAERHGRLSRQFLPNDDYFRALSLDRNSAAEAVQLLSRVLEADGTNFEARWERAWRYNELGKWQEMFGDADLLVQTHGNLATVWNARGFALGRLERFDNAIEAYDKAIRIDASNPIVYVNRADTLVHAGRLQDAIADCYRAIEIRNDIPTAYLVRGRAFLLEEALEPAQADFEHVLQFEPENVIALRFLGRIYAERGDVEAALANYDQAVLKAPEYFQAILERDQLLQALDRCSEAIVPWTRYIQLTNGRDARAYYYRGLCYVRLDDFESALRDYDQALVLDERLPYVYFARARVKRLMKRCQDALPDHEKSVELAPDSISAYVNWWATLRFLEQEEKALAALDEAIHRSATKNALLYLYIWESRMLDNQPEKAEVALAAARVATPTGWEDKLIARVAGVLTSENLVHAAETTEEKCEAYYIAGTTALVDGRSDEAMAWFRECVALRHLDYLPCDLSLWHLGKLGETANSR